ncbi:hypothetical protein [Streptomyces sp. WAC05858]|uniref:hypothetical protein n=1 Tax=Streptomyces TaxID=1883 RepID=UPI000F793913|nr:hypothetical protein [Streptomyces sp. WAC05858]RSS39440.1 hypothetical protein EF902_27520 [Streptomyces sp. WAC05858]
MTTPTTPRITALDVPAEQVAAEVPLRRAIARETALGAEAQVSALSLSLYLATHPDVHVSTEADYPGWTPGRTA